MTTESIQTDSFRNTPPQQLLKKALTKARLAAEVGGRVLGDATGAQQAKQKRIFEQADMGAQSKTKGSRSTFEEQLPKLAKRLLGKRFGSIATTVNKFVPASVTSKAADTAFMQLATLAQGWSRLDAPEAVADKSVLTLDDKSSLADKVADENRLLAAIGGGITGLTGLFGLIADLLWLMLICLKTIYQTAEIYGEALTGREGARRAFDILAQADLSKIGEKQAVMLGLGTLSEVVDESDMEVLASLVDSNSGIAMAQKALAGITEQLGVTLSLGWIDRFIPVAAGMTSAAYSVYIINEISAVAQAHFAPVLKLEDESART